MMKAEIQNQNLFHIFIQCTAQEPKETSYFPYFQYMNQSIRKAFHQLKKHQNPDQNTNDFSQYWNQISNEEKVKVYCNWVRLLQRAIEIRDMGSGQQIFQNVEKEDYIFIRKSLLSKWEKRKAKLISSVFIVQGSKKPKQLDLKTYALRKSKNKQYFGWVLESIQKKDKNLHCGVMTQELCEQWFISLNENINNERIKYFLKVIKMKEENNALSNFISPRNLDKYTKFEKKKEVLSQVKRKSEEKQKSKANKTITETVMRNHMSYNEELDQINENNLQNIEEIEKNQAKQSVQHPNIFHKLFPNYPLMNFNNFPSSATLLFCEQQCRIFDIYSSDSEWPFCLKLFMTLPYHKSEVFKILTGNPILWNSQVDFTTVKTKISSENAALIYEKDKNQGFLSRARDFFFMRHCFTLQPTDKMEKTFIVDKSIDSIHNPPFMTVARGEKELIWCIAGKKYERQCILVVEGWIKGGGYMNKAQDKEMTLRKLKKLMNIGGCLKQKFYTEKQECNIFLEDWVVDMNIKDEVMQKEQENVEVQEEEKSKQLEEFMKIAQNEEQNYEEKGQSQSSSTSYKKQLQIYTPPPFSSNKQVDIPKTHIKAQHVLFPMQKEGTKYYPHFRGHHLWKGQWAVAEEGGLDYVDEEKMKEQKKVLIYIIKRIGKNITKGKGILNISLPVDIFCRQSNIQRLAMSFGYGPVFLEKAAKISSPEEQLKYVIASGMGSSLIYMTMEKPFNPILGETYQCWVDNCPVYFEQISHHPPIAAFYMKGRGYTISGRVQAKMDLSINSGRGNNEGIFKIEFDNGNTCYYTTAAGELTGLTYGNRKLNLVGKSFYWTLDGLFLQISYNPNVKKGWFFNTKTGENEERMIDYFEGVLRKYPKKDVAEVVYDKKSNQMIIPKNSPISEPVATFYKVWGRWTKYTFCGQQKVFDVDEDRYFSIKEEPNPLPSHSNYREDIVYRRLQDVVMSQQFKQQLEIKQRMDRKLREIAHKK